MKKERKQVRIGNFTDQEAKSISNVVHGIKQLMDGESVSVIICAFAESLNSFYEHCVDESVDDFFDKFKRVFIEYEKLKQEHRNKQ